MKAINPGFRQINSMNNSRRLTAAGGYARDSCTFRRLLAAGYYDIHSLTSARLLAAAAVILLLFGMQGTALAQRKEALPTQLEGVDVVEHPGVQIPLDLKFVDSRGKPVTLKELFDSGRPVVLTLNYSNCPMLCGLQLNGLFEALKKMKWSIGDQYDMITLSFDPLESTARARLTKEKYLKAYRRAGADEGWHFLTGKEENIKKLADTIGFHYRYSPETKQYYHVAVTFIVMPDGRVSRYLYGVAYDPQTVRLSLVEAAGGKVGSTVDRILLFCCQYDAESGRYGLAAFRLMQVGGGFTVLLVGAAIWIMRRREKKAPPANPDS